MKVIDTSLLQPVPGKNPHLVYGEQVLTDHDSYSIYNGLDCAVTADVLNEIKPLLGGANAGNPNFDPLPSFINWGGLNKDDREFARCSARQLIYNFERASQAPALDMMRRGWRIDILYRDKAVQNLQKKDQRISMILDKFATAIWGRGLNPNSPKQLQAFFYDHMKLPEQYRFERGEKKLTTNRDALEKLHVYFYARPIINCCLALRDVRKKISVLTREVDSDKRMRTSYNITGTETSRWSSSANAYGGGTNLQNITEELRRAFIADPGYKLAYVDLEQAESRAVAWIMFLLFGDTTYLDACETGDLHTTVARMVWPSLPWTGDLKHDKGVAERIFYRHFTYRDLAKRGGHGTNYYGKPPTMARHLHVVVALIEAFQQSYFAAFPGFAKWHSWTAEQIQLYQYIQTPLGMGRDFFGRPNDDATLREAIAFVPQSMVAQLLNLALWRVWAYARDHCQLLGQVHDAIVIQYKEETEREVLDKILPMMLTPLRFNGRTMTIPSEASIGWNWQKRKVLKDGTVVNPDGLIKWTGSDERKRTENPESRRLDTVLSVIY